MILSLLLTFSLVKLITNSKPALANPATIMVSSGQSIQEAINNANLGDTILIAAGTFTETLFINKTIALKGSGQNVTIIQAPQTDWKTVIEVKANNINLSALTVQNGFVGISVSGYNSTIITNTTILSNVNEGIYLNASHNNIIANNTISLNRFEGIFLGNSTNNLISSNIVTRNAYVGIELLRSHKNRFSNNTISFHSEVSTRDQGLLIDSSNNNIIDGNIVSNNAWDVDIYFSHNNTFVGNTFSSGEYGIALTESNINTVHHNNFFYNRYQVDSFESNNTWDNGYPSGGNFWSDYTGVDLYNGPNQNLPGSDRIGDIPYVIDLNNRDRYPLIPPNPIRDNTPPNTTNDYNGLWHKADFAVTLRATDDTTGVKATYYKINGASTVYNVSASGQPIITTEGANNTLEYWSIDGAGNQEPHHNLTGIKLDKTPPTGSIQINNGEAYTTSLSVKLNLLATDSLSGIVTMRFSNDGKTYSQNEAYFTLKAWDLSSGDGVKTIYVNYTDYAGNSQIYYDTIVLDTSPPMVSIVSPKLNATIGSQTVTINWNGTDLGLGIDHYEIKLDGGLPTNVGDLNTYTFSGLNDGNHTVYVKAFDKIGRTNETSVSFVINASPPGGIGYVEEVALIILVVAAIGIIAYILRVKSKRRLMPELAHPSKPDLSLRNVFLRTHPSPF